MRRDSLPIEHIQSANTKVVEGFSSVKKLATDKKIDKTKFNLAKMGKFGNYLVKDVYGNLDFTVGHSIYVPTFE